MQNSTNWTKIANGDTSVDPVTQLGLHNISFNDAELEKIILALQLYVFSIELDKIRDSRYAGSRPFDFQQRIDFVDKLIKKLDSFIYEVNK